MVMRRWNGRVQWEGDADWLKGCTMMVVEGTVPAGRPKKTWQNCVSEDRVRWRGEIRRSLTMHCLEKQALNVGDDDDPLF